MKDRGSYRCPLCRRYMRQTGSGWACSNMESHGELGIVRSLDQEGKIFGEEVDTLAAKWHTSTSERTAGSKGGDKMKAVTFEEAQSTKHARAGAAVAGIVEDFLDSGLDGAFLDAEDLGENRKGEPRKAEAAVSQLTSYLKNHPEIPVEVQTRTNGDGEKRILMSRKDTDEGAKISGQKSKRTRKPKDEAEGTPEDQDALELANAGA
jgi:hypothetical protein